MNKNMALLIVGVFLLGMVLVIFNQYHTPPSLPPIPSAVEENIMSLPAEHLPESMPPTVAQNTEEETKEHETSSTLTESTTREQSAPLRPLSSPIAQIPTTPIAPIEEATHEEPAHEDTEAMHIFTIPSPIAEDPAPPAQSSTPVTMPSPIAEDSAPPAQSSTPATVPSPIVKTSETAEKSTAPATPIVQTEQDYAIEEKIIKKISVLTIGNGVTVRINSSELPRYKALQLKSPDRIVLDLDGQWQLKAPGVPKNEFVTNIRIAKQKTYTRIVIDLRKAPASIRYLKYGKTSLDVRIR